MVLFILHVVVFDCAWDEACLTYKTKSRLQEYMQ